MSKKLNLLMILKVLFVFSFAIGCIINASIFLNKLPDIFNQEEPGKKFIPLKKHTFNLNKISFLSNEKERKFSLKDLYQCQYALAPTIVQKGDTNQCLILVGYTKDLIPLKCKELRANIVSAFPEGVFLLKKI